MNTSYNNEAARLHDDDERTNIIDESTTGVDGNDNHLEDSSETEVEATSSNANSGWRHVYIGGLTGIVLGSTATFLMGMKKPDEETTSQEQETEPGMIEMPEQPTWSDGEVTVATTINDDMSFREAFAAARAETGTGGAFEWHGKVYSTYTAEEWNAMTPQQKSEYEDHFSWNHRKTDTSDQHDSSQNAYSSDHTGQTVGSSTGSRQSSSSSAETKNSTNQTSETTSRIDKEDKDDDVIEVVSVERSQPVAGEERGYIPPEETEEQTSEELSIVDAILDDSGDMEIEVLGMEYDTESNNNFIEIMMGGHEGVIIDVDGDMILDYMAVDLNDDDQLQNHEILNIRPFGWIGKDFGIDSNMTGSDNTTIDPAQIEEL